MGGGDGACAAAGAGWLMKGKLLLLGSTAWISMLAAGADAERQRLIHYVDLSGAHIVPTGTVQAATAAFDWARSALGISDIEEAVRLAESVAPGADGVLFAPWLQGERTPWWDEQIRGAFVGLSIRHTRAHLIRAVYEGVASGLHAALSVMEQDGRRPDPIAVLGGGARSSLWLSILADMTGGSSFPSGTGGGHVVGRGHGGRGGDGCLARLDGGASHRGAVRTGVPDGGRAARYARVAAAYARLYEALSSLGSISLDRTIREGRAAYGFE